eukprot:3301338-Alexandrium_andersonii.AAC.1
MFPHAIPHSPKETQRKGGHECEERWARKARKGTRPPRQCGHLAVWSSSKSRRRRRSQLAASPQAACLPLAHPGAHMFITCWLKDRARHIEDE